MDKFTTAERKFRKEGPAYDWKNRRLIIYLSLCFCAICVIYIMLVHLDLQVYQTIVIGAFSLAATIIGTYVFGRTWENISLTKTDAIRQVATGETQQPAQPPQETEDTNEQ